MTDLDRKIRATLQTLVALQGAKILQVEKEAEELRALNAEFARRELERAKGRVSKVEVQA